MLRHWLWLSVLLPHLHIIIISMDIKMWKLIYIQNQQHSTPSPSQPTLLLTPPNLSKPRAQVQKLKAEDGKIKLISQ